MLSVHVITPERLVREEQADFVVVPAFDGEMGILPKHAPLLAALVPGEIRLRRDGVVECFAVSGGFVEVLRNHVTILAETAEMGSEIDVERARLAVERAKSQLRQPLDATSLANIEASLKRALIRLQVSKNARRKTGHLPSTR
jgi:F-type H+-transporting ATPase subunit epsilon